MNENEGTDGLHLSGIIIALVLLGAWVTQQDGLSRSRPDYVPAALNGPTTVLDVPARLWEDPYEATARYRDGFPDVGADGPETLGAVDRRHDERVLANLAKTLKLGTARTRLILMPVMISGAAYAEVHERRIRVRKAVLAGLARWGYRPKTSAHLTYWHRLDDWNEFGGIASSVTPLDVLTGTGQVEDSAVVVLWLDSDRFEKTPLRRLGEVIRDFKRGLNVPVDGIGPLRDHADPAGRAENGFSIATRVIGPPSSGMLQRMVKELCALEKGPYYDALDGVALLSSTATTPTAKLSFDCADSGPKSTGDQANGQTKKALTEERLAELFGEKLGIHFLRTITTDDRVIEALVDELHARNIEPGCNSDQGSLVRALTPCRDGEVGTVGCVDEEHPYAGQRHHVVLISEWDTTYSDNLRALFNSQIRTRLCPDKPPEPAAGAKHGTNGEARDGKRYSICDTRFNIRRGLPWVHQFGYLRGIDGVLPGNANKHGDGAGSGYSAGTLTDSGYLEPASGNSQFDHLRRLAERVKALDGELRQRDQGSIRAIGVLGSDLFDKLLVLEAMREHFPSVVYFTTDLDARYLEPRHYPVARNLIIGSAFGLDLAPRWQGYVPPGRGVYATSSFLSAMLAVHPRMDECWRGKSFECPLDGKMLFPLDTDWVLSNLKAGVFETGRGRFFELRPAKQGNNGDGRVMEPPGKGPLADTGARLYRQLEPFDPLDGVGWHLAFALALGSGLALMLVPALRQAFLVRGHRGKTVLILVFVGMLPLGFLVWVVPGSLEPVALLSGVSAWPSEFIRYFAGLIAIGLIIRYGCLARSNDRRMCATFALCADNPGARSGNVRGGVAPCWSAPYRRWANRLFGVLCPLDGQRAGADSGTLPEPVASLCTDSQCKDLRPRWRWRSLWYGSRYSADEKGADDPGEGCAINAQAMGPNNPPTSASAVAPGPASAPSARGPSGTAIDGEGGDSPLDREWASRHAGESSPEDGVRTDCVQATAIWQRYRELSRGSSRFLRVGLMSVLMYVIIWQVVLMGEGSHPIRGDIALWVSFLVGMVWLAVPLLVLLLGTLDEMMLCNWLVRSIAPCSGYCVVWPDKLMARGREEKPGMTEDHLRQWINIQFVAKRTGASSRMVYGAFVVLLFVMLSLSTRFDNWETSTGVVGILGFCVLIALVSGVLVRNAARMARRQILLSLKQTASTIDYEEAARERRGVQVLIDDIEHLNEGAFRRWYQEPAVKALLWVASVASVLITEYVSTGM